MRCAQDALLRCYNSRYAGLTTYSANVIGTCHLAAEQSFNVVIYGLCWFCPQRQHRGAKAPARSPSWGRFTFPQGLAAVQLLRHEAGPTEAQDHHRRFAGMCAQRPTSSE
jgi:hypothetical protein